jgi:uncharacterized protein YndB with AHSA1/START domain
MSTDIQQPGRHPNPTTIEADPSMPTVRLVREFDAPVELVFRAFADPDLFRQWIGPRRHAVAIDVFDCTTGGRYRYGSDDEAGSHWFFGSFHEVRPNERIVQTFAYEGTPDSVALETATFEDVGSGRSRVTSLSVCDRIEDRDAMVASGMESGIVEGYEKLDELLDAST